MIALTLPWPCSSNRYWRSYVVGGRSIVALSTEAKKYKTEVARVARVAGIRQPLTGRVALTIGLYPAKPLDAAKRMRADPLAWDDTVRSLDLDNALKVLIDAIKGVVIDDDRWVRKIVAERFEPDGLARVELVVESIVTASPQPIFEVVEHLPAVVLRNVHADAWIDPFAVTT